MEATLKSGKIIKGRLARTLVSHGLAQEIKPKEAVKPLKVEDKAPVKKTVKKPIKKK